MASDHEEPRSETEPREARKNPRGDGPAGQRGQSEPEELTRAIEPLLGYLAVVARNLVAGDQARLEGASDLVQMTVVAALDNIAKGRMPGPAEGELKAWLRGIMINVRRQSLKRKRVAGNLVDDQVAADTTSPSGKASRDEIVRRMSQARTRLPERDRQVLDWKHEEKLTFQAIGERLAISAVAAHKAHRRALERLEDAFLTAAAEETYQRSRIGLKNAL